MKADHKAALKWAQGTYMPDTEHANLAAAYLDLREKVKAVLRIIDRNQDDVNALRDVLEEK